MSCVLVTVRRALLTGVLIIPIAGCSVFGGGVDSVSVDAKSPVAVASVTPMAIALTNENWDLAVKDADRYRGSSVDITGQIFYVIGDYEGASHYQLFTNAQDRTGNTHLAVDLAGPKLSDKDIVRVVGTLDRMLVTTSRGGDDLRLPYVVASAVDVLGGSAATVTAAAALATPVSSPSPTVAPPTATVVTPTATIVTPTATLTVPTATAVPATATKAPPSATASAIPPTSTRVPATSTSVPNSTPSPTRVGPVSIEAPLTSFTTTASMGAAADPAAPGGQYLASTGAARDWSGTGPIPSGAGTASVNVTVPKNGRYAVWVRMQYQNVDANSVWLVVDNQKAVLVGNETAGYGDWKWVGWRDGNAGARIAIDLAAGNHTVTIVSREAGTRFDGVLITDDINQKPANPAPSGTPVSSGDQPPAASVSVPTASTSNPVAQATSAPAPAATRGVVLASVTPSPPIAGTATPASGSYTVQPGDTLSGIAQRVYGDAGQYPRIFAANRDKLSSPDRIAPGMQLQIPR